MEGYDFGGAVLLVIAISKISLAVGFLVAENIHPSPHHRRNCKFEGVGERGIKAQTIII